MSSQDDLEALLAEIVQHHEQHGTLPPIEVVAARRPDLVPELHAMAYRYLDVSAALDTGGFAIGPTSAGRTEETDALPAIEGFRTIERIGAGGMGEVYKLHDLTLDRVVAAKIVRRGQRGPAPLASREFLREARSLALFSDPRIVRIFEYRVETDPAVIIMEYIDGFELGRVGRSLEIRQRARVMRDVCEAVHHAHTLGIQHRDLKPSNIMLDHALSPKILDFGLSHGDPARGHLRGTVHYLAPEQLDPARPIDNRTDVYALGVILYELLCGATPYTGATDEVLAAVRVGRVRLPAEIDPAVPEALQAIALKAMERQPADRYQSAQDMARDLDSYLAGRPVSARPTQYTTTLASRVAPHVAQIAEWVRLKLIYPHEADRLRSAYRALDAREDDWIVASRALTPSQIALYLGAFFLFAGALFYFVAQRVYGATTGLAGPTFVLGLPFLGLNVMGRWLYRREHQAVAVAFFLGGLSLLPLYLLIVMNENTWWVAAEGAAGQLFTDGSISNRQLQITSGVACAWGCWLALRTRTSALSTAAVVLAAVATLGLLADVGLRTWIEDGRYDRLGAHLLPLVATYGLTGWLLERGGRPWFARPAFVGGAILLVVSFDLLALDGRMLNHAGVTLRMLQPADVEDPVLLDTLAGLSLNGVLFYALAAALDRRGTAAMSTAAQVLFTIAPFSMLEPLAYLSETALFDERFDWIYLVLAVVVALLSHRRQRKSFYYAGLLNAGVALYLIALRNDWFDDPGWAVAVVVTGLTSLVVGFLLARRAGVNGRR